MKVLNFGSLNIDYTYQVEHIVNPKETISSLGLEVFPGGKGLNQSIALAKAGGGSISCRPDRRGRPVLERSVQQQSCAHRLYKRIRYADRKCDHSGEQRRRKQHYLVSRGKPAEYEGICDEVLGHFGKEIVLLLQNEINEIPYIVESAYKKDPYCAEPISDGQ